MPSVDLEKLNLKRAFASFGGDCPFKCLHCYTFHKHFQKAVKQDIEAIIDSLASKDFDIVYISGYTDSFINPQKGITLAERIFDCYGCDILFTTRNIFNNEELDRLAELKSKIDSAHRLLISCVSICALESYEKIESSPIIPSPWKRIEFITRLHERGIPTFLTLRPLFPSAFIPIEEVERIIELSAPAVTSVISSGIVLETLNDPKLPDFPQAIKFYKAPLMSCLKNNYDVFYIDVTSELKRLQVKAAALSIPFFFESSPAVHYVRRILQESPRRLSLVTV